MKKLSNNIMMVRRLFPNLTRQMLITCAIIAGGILLTICTAIFLRQSMDRIENANAFSDVIYILITFTVLTIFTGLLKFIQDYVPNKFILIESVNLKRNIVAHFTDVELGVLNNNKYGDLITRVNDDIGTVACFLGYDGINSLAWVMASVCSIAFVFTLSWKLALLGFVLTPVLAVVMRKIGEKISTFSRKSRETMSDANSFLLQAIEGNQEIKTFNIQNTVFQEFHTLSETLKKNSIISGKWANIMNLIGSIGSIVSLSVTFLFGCYLVYNREMTIGAWLSYYFLLEYTNSIFSYLPLLVSGYENAAVSIERLVKLLDFPVEESSSENSHTVADIGDNPVLLEFKDVTFIYPLENGDGIKALNGISFKINKGDKVCIVGANGCGKSTILNILLRFYNHTSGEVLYKGRHIEEIDPEVLRREIALADQSSYLFPYSIAKNISFGSNLEEAQYDESFENDISVRIRKVAGMACVDTFLADKEEGYRTLVNEKGSSLSGGQKQMISIARALLKDALILCMDEATSSIDGRTEERIIKNIISLKDQTCIFVAHRLSAYRDMDRILVIDHGKVAEEGSYEYLMEKQGLYYEMFKKQEYTAKEMEFFHEYEKVC